VTALIAEPQDRHSVEEFARIWHSEDETLGDTRGDLEEIEVLLARYGNRLDRSDHSGWVDLFTTDGRFEVYGRSFEGPEGLLRMAESAPGGLHLTSAALIEIDGDSATVEQSFLFVDQVSHESRIGCTTINWYAPRRDGDFRSGVPPS